MSACTKIADYLDRHLSDEERQEFFLHLESCASCREALDRWRAVDDALNEGEDEDHFSAPTMRETSHLVHRFKKTRTPISTVSRPFLLATAALAVLVLVGISYFSVDETPPPPLSTAPKTPQPFDFDGSYIVEAPADASKHEPLRDNLLAMGPGARVRVQKSTRKRTVLELLNGKIACRVASTPQLKQFDVKAGKYLVQVTGTRFSVSFGASGGVEVIVSEGSVDVSHELGRSWKLSERSALVSKDAAISTIATATPFRLEQVDQMLDIAEMAPETPEGDSFN